MKKILSIISLVAGLLTFLTTSLQSYPLLNGITLCGQFGSLPIDQNLGSNSGVPTTAGLGSGISDKNLFIDGTFTIQQDFTFTNCNIRFTPGSSIVIQTGSAPVLKRILTVDHCNLFSCGEGLWKGIEMQRNTRIDTRNNTQIEDAQTSIIAHQCATSLSIASTTFNRNWVGISLDLAGDCFPAVFTKLQNSQFTCTSPLNSNPLGTLSHAGIRTRNVPIVATSPIGAFNVRMENLRFGILDESTSVLTITIRAFQFNNLREDGIQVIRGKLQLNNCSFFNCLARGIDATTIHRLIFK